MSVEFKCDRCGEPIPPGDVSRTSGNFTIWRDKKESTFDLCKDCLDKMDVFMSGKMPAPEYKHGELAYLDLPASNVVASDDRSCNRLYLHASMDLDQVEQLFSPYGPWPEIKQVILGVKLR